MQMGREEISKKDKEEAKRLIASPDCYLIVDECVGWTVLAGELGYLPSQHSPTPKTDPWSCNEQRIPVIPQ